MNIVIRAPQTTSLPGHFGISNRQQSCANFEPEDAPRRERCAGLTLISYPVSTIVLVSGRMTRPSCYWPKRPDMNCEFVATTHKWSWLEFHMPCFAPCTTKAIKCVEFGLRITQKKKFSSPIITEGGRTAVELLTGLLGVVRRGHVLLTERSLANIAHETWLGEFMPHSCIRAPYHAVHCKAGVHK